MERAQLPKVALYCKKDGSDKEYRVEIIEVVGGYSLKIMNGKRGAAKEQRGEKPVLTLGEAKKEFERIVAEKTSIKKGYTFDESGTGYASSELAGKMSGNLPHLLIPISFDKLQELACDDLWMFEQKIDGERLMCDRKDNRVTTSNKLGAINSASMEIVDSVLKIAASDICLDGESKDHQYHVFDMTRLNGQCLKDIGTKERYNMLASLLERSGWPANIILIQPAFTSEEKKQLIQDAFKGNEANLVEGIVAKRVDAPYLPGKATPTTATHLKFKFTEDTSCLIVGVSKTKRSATLGLYVEDGSIREVGNVGIPVNQSMPGLQDVIDVRYRHLFFGGDFCEPVYLKPRTDVLPEDCTVGQVTRIKMRTGNSDIDDESTDSGTKYLFYIEGLKREVWQSGESAKVAHQALWESLTEDEKNRVVQIECIDEAQAS